MDIETRRKISQTMKGRSNFEGHKHTHATKLQIGFSQEGHRNAKDHKWATDKESGEEHRIKGKLPKGLRWGRKGSLGEAVWDQPSPAKKPTKLSAVMKARAKARAKAAGRPYPNMVDNIWAARNESESSAKRLEATDSLRKIYTKNTPGQKNMKINEAKATYCGRCGTTHVAPKFGGTCPALKEEQVNELKKSTLASYLDKTVDPVHGMPRSATKLSQRLAGIRRASKKIMEVRSEYSKAAHDEDGQALGIKPGSTPEPNPIVRHEVQQHGGKHYISVVHKSGMSYSHKGPDGNTQNFNSKEEAEKKAAELDKSNIGKERVDEVSKGLLARYTQKAATSMSTAAFGQGQASASRRPPSEKDQKTGYKRMLGIVRATSKMAKESTEVPFEGPYTKSKEAEKDKSGATHTPMSRARHLARLAMKAKNLKDSQK